MSLELGCKLTCSLFRAYRPAKTKIGKEKLNRLLLVLWDLDPRNVGCQPITCRSGSHFSGYLASEAGHTWIRLVASCISVMLQVVRLQKCYGEYTNSDIPQKKLHIRCLLSPGSLFEPGYETMYVTYILLFCLLCSKILVTALLCSHKFTTAAWQNTT